MNPAGAAFRTLTASLLAILFIAATSLFAGSILGFGGKDASEAPELVAAYTESAPFIDGSGGDAQWSLARPFTFKAPSGNSGRMATVTVKALHTDSSVFLLMQWPATFESRWQSSWTWDPGLQIYTPGDEREECLSVYWVVPASRQPFDVWVWRAGRTDPSGHADDLSGVMRAAKPGFFGGIELKFDSGVICWRNSSHSVFAGERLPRFVSRTPEGSAADVKAKGVWADGVWTLELERLKTTGNGDDIDIKEGAPLVMAPSLEAPGSWRAAADTPVARFILAPRIKSASGISPEAPK